LGKVRRVHPTFKHPNLTEQELRFLLGAAYTRFYMRPSYLANFLKIQNSMVREWVTGSIGASTTAHAGRDRRFLASGHLLT
jgi:hypothetical protein